MTKSELLSEIADCLTLIEDLELRMNRLRNRLKQIQRNQTDKTGH